MNCVAFAKGSWTNRDRDSLQPFRSQSLTVSDNGVFKINLFNVLTLISYGSNLFIKQV